MNCSVTCGAAGGAKKRNAVRRADGSTALDSLSGWDGKGEREEERGDREIPCNTSSGSSVVENGPGEGKDGGRGYSKIPSFTRPGAAPHRDAAEQKIGLNIVTKGYKSCFVNAQRKVSLQFVPGDHPSAVRGAD